MAEGAAAARLERIFRSVALALAALAALIVPASAQQQAQPAQRIVAIGDLHGDHGAWVDIARDAGLMDARGRWSGGSSILVQLGDITDRGPDSLKIIRDLQRLQAEAPGSGGRVVVVLGNHEAMNLLGDTRYVSPGEFAAFADDKSAARRDATYDANRRAIETTARLSNPRLSSQQIRDSWFARHPLGAVEHLRAWGPSGELGRWATGNPAIAKIGGTLFVHGGISAEYSRLPLEQVNRRTALAMRAGVGGANSILDDPLGPLWYRGLAMRDADAAQLRGSTRPPTPPLTVDQELDIVLKAYGAQRIVIGHTPSLKGILITNGARLARIDTGISRHYGGPLSWLEINGTQMVPHTVRRSAP